MIFDVNKSHYTGSGGKSDIKLSMQDYFELVGGMKQINLDNKMLMKFKNIYMVNGFSCFALILGSTIPSYIGTRLVVGPLRRGHANYKIYTPVFTTIYLMTFYFGSYKEIPRRLYTEVFAEESEQGTYLRRLLKDEKPNLWQHISSQLTNLGYTFPEQLEINEKEFPTALLK